MESDDLQSLQGNHLKIQRADWGERQDRESKAGNLYRNFVSDLRLILEIWLPAVPSK